MKMRESPDRTSSIDGAGLDQFQGDPGRKGRSRASVADDGGQFYGGLFDVICVPTERRLPFDRCVALWTAALTPSGLGVREGLLYVLLAPVLAAGGAIGVALVMRFWEVGLER
jgi:hypothetical protein